METGFVNSHDGDHLSVMSHFYDQGMLEDSESLLNMMQDDFSFSSLASSHLIGSHSLWDQDTSDGTDAELHGPFSVDSPPTDVLKEDFQKMLSDWQEHLGSLQASDSEEMDVKDLVGLDMHMPKNVPVEIPTDIFEDSPCSLKTVLSVEKLHETPKDRIFSGLSLNSFNLENFLEDDDEEEHKFGLIVAEEEDLTVKVNSDSSDKRSQVGSVASSENTNATKISRAESAPQKAEAEEEAIDVETVMDDQIPVLEAGDLKTLLEQFEASEAVNSNVGTAVPAVKTLASELSVSAAATQPTLPKKRMLPSTVPCTSALTTNSSFTSATTTTTILTTTTSSSTGPAVETNRVTLHESIRDSLPQEVIDRIKASNRRKPISVIPAMPSRRPGRGATRMQVAAATLSRNKLLKLVSSGGKGGESIQLDHDYCSSAASPSAEVAPPKSFYHSNASEYASEQSQSSPSSSKDSEDSSCAKSVLGDSKVYSRLPEYYVVLAPQKALEKGRKGTIKEEMWDKNSRKDSGLESGEVSDASEETVGTPAIVGSRDVSSNSVNSIVKNEDRKCGKNIVPCSTEKGAVTIDVQNKGDILDRKKTAGVFRAEGSQCVLKDWSSLRQDNGKSKPVAMVSVLKKNNVGCTTNVANRQQSLLISSNSNSSNSSSSSIGSNSSSTSSHTTVETEKIKSEGPKKRKLNLEEYRSRLKEMDRTRIKEEDSKPKSVSVATSTSNSNVVKADGISTQSCEVKKEEECAVISSRISTTAPEEDKLERPKMQSVEVQTQTSIFDEAQEEHDKSKERKSRKKQRKYCSKRASSSSSSHSTSSSGSRRRRKSRSQMRRRTSRRRSHGGHSVSSSGSQRPRSRSNSSRSSSSYSSYSSRSRSRSRSRSSARRSPSCGRPRSTYPYQHRYGPRRPLPYSTGWRSRSRTPPYGPRKSDWMLSEREKQRQVEERRVIYVGRIDEGTSKAELRRRFEPFGPIIDISVHFREHGDNYGFVTFAYKVDAYEAVEHGNDDPNLPHYDLCFGGRRAFCKTRYADLDGIATSNGPSGGYIRGAGYTRRTDSQPEDFDLLLREAQAKLRKRKV